MHEPSRNHTKQLAQRRLSLSPNILSKNCSMTKITKTQALQRTKRMLVREWNLAEEPTSDADLRKAPPNGLGKNNNQIRALETPIETDDFLDVEADVDTDNLVKAKTVGELRDQIWTGIPTSQKV